MSPSGAATGKKCTAKLGIGKLRMPATTMPKGASRNGKSAPCSPMDNCKRSRQKMNKTFHTPQALGMTAIGKTMTRSPRTVQNVRNSRYRDPRPRSDILDAYRQVISPRGLYPADFCSLSEAVERLIRSRQTSDTCRLYCAFHVHSGC